MARISEVIHVKQDGVVKECALFDASSDIPSPATAREFGLNGAKVYGAVLDEKLTSENDDDWVYDNHATPLAFHDGSSALHLLTTPYYIRPLVESLEFGADGGTVNIEGEPLAFEQVDGILTTNGEYSMRYRCDYDGISVMDMETVYGLKWVVVCGENTSSEDIAFTLTLTFSFADGSTQDITFSGTQSAAAEPQIRTITFDFTPTNASLTVNGVLVLARLGLYSMSAYDGDVLEWSCECDGYVTQSGSHTVNGNYTITIRLTEGFTIG